MKEKNYEKGKVSEVSKFNSEQCPTSKIKCHICRIEMQITEVIKKYEKTFNNAFPNLNLKIETTT